MTFYKYAHSIKSKLIINIILIHTLLMGFVIYDMLKREQNFMQKQLSTKGHDLTSILASSCSINLINNDYVALHELINEIGRSKEFGFTFIMDKEFIIKASNLNEYISQTLTDSVSQEIQEKIRDSSENYYQSVHDNYIDTISKVYIDKELVGYTRTLLSNKNLQEQLALVRNKALFYILLAISLGALFAWISVRKMTSSLSQLSSAAKEISLQNFNTQLPTVTGNDEISSVVRAFHVMQSSLQSYIFDLQKAKQRYESFFQNNRAIELILEPKEQRIEDFNDAALEFYGYSKDEMKNMHISNINMLTTTEIEQEMQLAVLEERNYFIFQHRLATGEVRDVEIYAGPIELEGSTYIYSVVHDITKRVALERENKKIHERLNFALEATNDGLWDWNLRTDTIYFSPKYKEMLGYRDEEFCNIFENFQEHIHPDDRERTLLSLHEFLKSTELFYEQNFRMRTKSRGYIPIMSRAKKILDTNNRPIRVAGTHVDISEITKVQKKLKFQAEHDILTSLPNRLLFLDRLQQSLKSAQGHNEKLAILFMDLDHFKEVNDSLGHAMGDSLLEAIAKRLKEAIRESDTVARIGGDEFTVMIDRVESCDALIDIVTEIIDTLKRPLLLDGHTLYTTFSIGIALYPDDGKSAEELLKNSDTAMYKAKEQGRNRYQFYTDDMTKQALHRIEMEANLRRAIFKSEFEVYYQPQIDGRDNSLIGMEALIRWIDPLKGMISPAEFIPLAEDTGMIVEIDDWVMKSVMFQTALWHKDALHVGLISLNVSVLQLNNIDFIQKVERMLKESSCRAEWIGLEVTESLMMQDVQNSMLLLQKLSAMGFKISIDDFGTGYSSLSYLKKFPIDKLKIDQSFVRDIHIDESDREIVRTIIAMSKNLNMGVIAEGVETKEERDFLVKNGCNDIQGYYYYKPLPLTQIDSILRL